jgi:hypothetical protein
MSNRSNIDKIVKYFLDTQNINDIDNSQLEKMNAKKTWVSLLYKFRYKDKLIIKK